MVQRKVHLAGGKKNNSKKNNSETKKSRFDWIKNIFKKSDSKKKEKNK